VPTRTLCSTPERYAVVRIAVARRYAKALFGLVDEPGIEGARIGLIGLARAVAESSALKHLLASPAFDLEQKREVLAALSQRLGCPPIINDFLAQLIKKNRVTFLPEIAETFKTLVDEQRGIRRVAVNSAQSLGSGEQERLRSQLRELLHRDVDVVFESDPRLLAGLQIRIGSTVFDSTVRNRLTAMRALVTKE
jgi:F-type H+-transporting ATPase subunit delta